MRLILLISALLTLAACGKENTAIELQFIEQEAGIDPYKTRMIITDDFLRIDDGPKSRDFILYDRKALKISSVSSTNKRVFEIPYREIEAEKPADLVWQHKEVEASNAPTIENIKPTGHNFSANDETCLQTMSAKGLLEEARLALIEYQSILAGEHAANMSKTPAELGTPCDTALSIFHATDSLKFGFPIIEWDSAGHRRQLENYTENASIPADLFTVPEDYESFTLEK